MRLQTFGERLQRLITKARSDLWRGDVSVKDEEGNDLRHKPYLANTLILLGVFIVTRK